MTINVKKPKGMAGRKRSASAAARVLATRKKAAAPESVRRVGAPAERTQLREADEMLKRIERKSEVLSATADRLLKRVS
jgi:hypothetical protein